MSARILVIEDDENLAIGLAYNLERAGYAAMRVGTAKDGLRCLADGAHDLLLLDLMLPDRSGFEVLEELRRCGNRVPVIVLSARGEEVDKLRGFDLGAADYVTKPFSLAELLARVRARLEERGLRARVELGDLTLDFEQFVVRRNGRDERLTQTEVALLRCLLNEGGRPVTRESLVRSVWNLAAHDTRTLDTHIARLRKKLETEPARPRLLQTVHGVGYRLALPDEEGQPDA